MPYSLADPAVTGTITAAQAAAGTAQGLTPSPEDWRDRWIYFLMLDRFNNPAAPPAHTPWDDPDYYGFQGGTFAGVQAQLPYLSELGVGAIWLSPVLKNLRWDPDTYHGYGIHDFLHAEPRFCSDPQTTDPTLADNELRALVDAAHALDIMVVFDIVLNHVGDVFAYTCAPGDTVCTGSDGSESSYSPVPAPVCWRDANGIAVPADTDVAAIASPSTDAVVWPSELHDNACFRRQGGPQPGGDDTIGDFASLKQMRTDLPGVQDALIGAYQYVIARFDVDGFRIDTLRYLQGGYQRVFGNAMREFAQTVGKENFFTFGEVFDAQAETDIARFIGRNTATSDGDDLVGVDAALDYPLYFAFPGVAKGFTPPTSLNAMYAYRLSVEQGIVSSHGDATRYFVTFIDNHDVKARFRYVAPDGSHPYDAQVPLALGCLFSLPGIPCVYYGTEQGLHGYGSDPAVREALWGGPGFAPDGLFCADLRALAAVRAALPALRYGRYYFRPLSGDGVTFGLSAVQPGVLAFSRILAGQEVLVVANTSATGTQHLQVIVDQTLNAPGDLLAVRYSNAAAPTAPGALTPYTDVTVFEADGSTGGGPVLACPVTVQPMEVQILAQPAQP